MDRPKIYFTSDITDSLIFIKPKVYKKRYFYKDIKRQGQLKLLISEIRFLSEDVEIHNLKNDKFLILYIGSGKGLHIPYLITLYKDFDIIWYLFDPVGHCNRLYDYQLQNPHKLIIKDEKFEIEHIDMLKKLKDRIIIFISDIRSIDEGITEPTIQNLLADYHLQNYILKNLNPNFSLVKFRMPFYDTWIANMNFEKPIGKEYIQPFLANDSNEFRIMLGSIIEFELIDNIEKLIYYEQRFAWYNFKYRIPNSNDFQLAIYVFNLYKKTQLLNIDNKAGDNILNNDLNFRNIKIFLKQIVTEIQDIDKH